MNLLIRPVACSLLIISMCVPATLTSCKDDDPERREDIHTPTGPRDENDDTPQDSDEPGGENPGGENPGGENPGGENPGGENPGGENPGGEDPGGENPGGENPGGENPGGENPGGENPGGENPGGENPGGENPGGENPGGENPGGDEASSPVVGKWQSAGGATYLTFDNSRRFVGDLGSGAMQGSYQYDELHYKLLLYPETEQEVHTLELRCVIDHDSMTLHDISGKKWVLTRTD